MHDVLVLVMKLVVCALLLPVYSYLAIQIDVRLPQIFTSKSHSGGSQELPFKTP